MVLIGDHRKYLTMLVTLKVVQDLETMSFTDALTSDALDVNPNVKKIADAIKDPIWNKYIQSAVDKYNSDASYSIGNGLYFVFYFLKWR